MTPCSRQLNINILGEEAVSFFQLFRNAGKLPPDCKTQWMGTKGTNALPPEYFFIQEYFSFGYSVDEGKIKKTGLRVG